MSLPTNSSRHMEHPMTHRKENETLHMHILSLEECIQLFQKTVGSWKSFYTSSATHFAQPKLTVGVEPTIGAPTNRQAILFVPMQMPALSLFAVTLPQTLF